MKYIQNVLKYNWNMLEMYMKYMNKNNYKFI